MYSTSERLARTLSPPTPAALATGDRGATGVEYALIGSLIAGAIALTVGLLGADVLDLWGRIDW